MTYDQWKTTDPREYTQPDEEEQSEFEYLCDQLRATQALYAQAIKRNERLISAIKHVVDELSEDAEADDGQPNKAMHLATELKIAMYGPGGFR